MFLKEDVGIISKPTDPEVDFLWTFPNCLSFYKYKKDDLRQCVLCSPVFSFFNIKWRLVLIRHCFYDRYMYEKVGLFLWKISSTNCLPDVIIKLGMKTSNSEKTVDGQLNRYGCFGTWDFEESSYFYDKKNECSADGFLRVYCKFQKEEIVDEIPQNSSAVDEQLHCSDVSRNEEEVEEDEITSDEENNDNNQLLSKDKGIKILVENLKQAFLDGRMSDVVLKVDNREFNVHRMMLASRSLVFASMFQHEMREKEDNVVDIPDCTAESFEVFLGYLYSGSAKTLSTSNVYNVYYAADKYGVNHLKEKCVDFMSDYISVETFCDVITLALRHGEKKLKETAIKFFCDNVREIIRTVQWQTYLDQNSTHANELLIRALDA